MKGLAVSMQLECACGELVQHKHSSTGFGNQLPMVQGFTAVCVCGMKYFTHVQEVKPAKELFVNEIESARIVHHG